MRRGDFGASCGCDRIASGLNTCGAAPRQFDMGKARVILGGDNGTRPRLYAERCSRGFSLRVHAAAKAFHAFHA